MNIAPANLIRRLYRYMSTASNPNLGVSSTSRGTPTVDHSSREDELYRYLKIKCSGHEPAVLDSYEKFLMLAAKHLDIKHVSTQAPFRRIIRRTLLACRFVKKKYRVQYEFRTYKRDLLFKNLTGSTADTFLEYIERNIPEGVLMKAERHKLARLPFELMNSSQAEGEKVDIKKSGTK